MRRSGTGAADGLEADSVFPCPGDTRMVFKYRA